jgi:hypothetical protein
LNILASLPQQPIPPFSFLKKSFELCMGTTLCCFPHSQNIRTKKAKLKEEELDLEKEDAVAGFLGVRVQKDDKNSQIYARPNLA